MSIGADEYDADLADDYNNFVNDMVKLNRRLRTSTRSRSSIFIFQSDFIQNEANKSIRIWSTSEPSNRTSVSKRIILQHWYYDSLS